MNLLSTSSFALSLTAVCVFTQSGCLMSLKNDSIELPSQMTKPTAINNIRQINSTQNINTQINTQQFRQGSSDVIDVRPQGSVSSRKKLLALFGDTADNPMPQPSISNNDNPIELKPRQQPTNDQNNASQ